MLGFAPSFVLAGEVKELYRGTRAQAMGGASIALADDEQAVFLNPAGMAGVKKAELHLVTNDLSISTDVIGTAGAIAAIRSLDGNTLNTFMGKNIYVQDQFTPTLLMPNFGIALLSDGQFGLGMENKSLPHPLLIYQTTNAIQVSAGMTLGDKRFGKSVGEFRLGVGGKIAWRRGGYRKLNTVTLLTLSKDSVGEIVKDWGTGYGLDLGSQWIRPIGKVFKVSASAVYTDIGDTNFGDGPDPIKGNLAWGLGLQGDFGPTYAKLAYEYRHLLDETDFRKKNHIGLEVGMPLISFFGGINQTYLTYGAAIDLWMFKLTGASYAEEQGSLSFQNPERRYMLRLDVRIKL